MPFPKRAQARRSNGTELTLRLLDPRLGRPLSTEAVASWQPTRRTSPPSPQQPSRGDKGSAHAQAKRAQASQDESAYAGELETCERCASAKYVVHGGRRATFFSGGVCAAASWWLRLRISNFVLRDIRVNLWRHDLRMVDHSTQGLICVVSVGLKVVVCSVAESVH
eukprot:6174505-Pleurochrysis_carterae.AAC.4